MAVLPAPLLFWAQGAQAAHPATINVTVTVPNLSVRATGPIAFGTVTAASAAARAVRAVPEPTHEQPHLAMP